MFKYLVALSLLVLCLGYTEEKGILILGQSDFAQAVQQFPFLFVKFYTPWCGHCKKLAPIFQDLAASLLTSQPSMKLAKIDLDAHKSIQEKYKVYSFPTLILFKNGVEVRFGGSRDFQFMTFWLNKKVLPPIVTIPADKLASLETDGNVNIVFYGELSSPKAEILSKLSSVDNYNMFYNVEASGKPENTLQIFRPFAKSVQNNVIDNNIKNWIALFDRPFVFPFDDRASSEVFTDKRNAVLLFAPQGETHEAVRRALLEVAAQSKIQLKKRLVFAEILDEEDRKGLSDYFKINPDKHFLVFVKTAQKLKYLYNGTPAELTKQKITEFIKQVEGSKIKPVKLDQETRPAGQTKTAEQL